jgi:Fuseless
MYVQHYHCRLFQRTTTSRYFTASNHSYKRLIYHSRKNLVKEGATRKLSLPKLMQKSAPSPLIIDQSPFSAYTDSMVVLYNVFIGMCSASFWRGAWYILDDILFPNNKELSAISSLMLGAMGMLSVQGFFERVEKYTLHLINENKAKQKHEVLSIRSIKHIHSMLRFTVIYSLVLSVVCVWRGTWMSWDILYAKYYNDYSSSNSAITTSTDTTKSNQMDDSNKINASDPGHALRSGLMSHYTAVFILCSLGIVASVFAPPAAVSVIRDNTIFSTRTSIERILYPKNYSQRIKAHPSRRSKFVHSWWRQRRNA